VVLSYYNPLDKSIHVTPGSDPPTLPNKPLERSGMIASLDVPPASAGRSAPMR
jgi:hypothetical protein